MSPLSRGRELKLNPRPIPAYSVPKSPLSRGRELKYNMIIIDGMPASVAPLAGA